jgi:hypothetical protein
VAEHQPAEHEVVAAGGQPRLIGAADPVLDLGGAGRIRQRPRDLDLRLGDVDAVHPATRTHLLRHPAADRAGAGADVGDPPGVADRRRLQAAPADRPVDGVDQIQTGLVVAAGGQHIVVADPWSGLGGSGFLVHA